MADKGFGFTNFLIRLIMAMVLVFVSYNPSGYSWYHWLINAEDMFDPLLILSGILLLIGWVITIRATTRSLGLAGGLLAVAFFAALIWVLVDYQWLSLENPTVFQYVILAMLAAVMAMGMSWSHIRRRITGQLDVDEIEG